MGEEEQMGQLAGFENDAEESSPADGSVLAQTGRDEHATNAKARGSRVAWRRERAGERVGEERVRDELFGRWCLGRKFGADGGRLGGRTASHACPPRRLGADPHKLPIRSSLIRVVY